MTPRDSAKGAKNTKGASASPATAAARPERAVTSQPAAAPRSTTGPSSAQGFRVEKDSMGDVRVPAERVYGAQTQRAVDNFKVSGRPMPARFLSALAQIKWASAQANEGLGLLDARIAAAIRAAADEVIAVKHAAEFPIDVFQTGSGTSSNMNMNEVLSNLANRALGSAVGSKSPVHPNDHVNLGQSSNDVIPTALHLS